MQIIINNYFDLSKILNNNIKAQNFKMNIVEKLDFIN